MLKVETFPVPPCQKLAAPPDPPPPTAIGKPDAVTVIPVVDPLGCAGAQGGEVYVVLEYLIPPPPAPALAFPGALTPPEPPPQTTK